MPIIDVVPVCMSLREATILYAYLRLKIQGEEEPDVSDLSITLAICGVPPEKLEETLQGIASKVFRACQRMGEVQTNG